MSEPETQARIATPPAMINPPPAEPRPLSAPNLEAGLGIGSGGMNRLTSLPQVRGLQTQALQRRLEAQTGAVQAEQAGRREEAAALSEAGRARISADDEARDLYERRRQNVPTAFVPTQENVADYATLFSLLGVVGTALGGKGKGNAMTAMSSMTGMLNGWRQGRVDLYQRERQNFDASLRAIQAANEDARQVMQDAVQRNKGRYDLAAIEARNKLVERGDQIAARTLEAQGYTAFAELLDKRGQDIQQAMSRSATLANQAPQAVKIGDQWVYAQRRGNTFVPMQMNGAPVPAPPPPGSPEYVAAQAAARRGAAGQQDRFGFGDIVATASNEAAAEIANLVDLAEESTSGVFQGRNTTGLLNAPLGALTNAITSEEAQRYNIVINNFGKFLAQVQKGGRVVGQREMSAAADPFIIREGDTPMTVLTRIAGMRQGLERAIDVRLASPNTPDSLKAVYQNNLETIQQAIPFTVGDVNRFMNQRDQRRTFADMMRESGVIGQPAPNAPRPAAAPSGPPSNQPPAPTETNASGQPAADPLEGRTAIGPNGQRIVRRGGQWVPVQ